MAFPSVFCVHRFSGTDPFENLAREEVWLDSLAPGAGALLLYVNSPCVVFGRHQNPLREVRFEQAVRRAIPLVRRASGGGTVWHDEGNLNWSLILPKEAYDRGAVSSRVAEALGSLGCRVEPGEKGDLFCAGKKVSGAAFLVRKDRVLHHGTLLCRARLEDLRGVLGPTGELVEWVGVPSRPMAVANLDREVGDAAAVLVRTFSSVDRGAAIGDGRGDGAFEALVAARRKEREAAAWIWDQTPPFTWAGETRFGKVQVQVRDGVVEALLEGDPGAREILGKRFFRPEVWEYLPIRPPAPADRDQEEW